MALKVGLTGGIGSGKTTIARMFELVGVPVYYADTATKDLYKTNPELKAAIVKHFGEAIYQGEELDRAKLAAEVFDNNDKLQLLNAIVHPLVIKDAESWMARQTQPYIIKEAALLFESGSVSELDYVIGVSAPKHIRLKRAIDRDNANREEIISRMNRQIDEDIKMRLCDFVIQNNEQQLVIPQVLTLHQHLLNLATNSST